jgi:hypothetical protein
LSGGIVSNKIQDVSHAVENDEHKVADNLKVQLEVSRRNKQNKRLVQVNNKRTSPELM